MAGDHGIQHHQFYRQSGLFVAYLANRNPSGFGAFLDGLHRGEDFAVAFETHLGTTVREAWTAFVESVRADERGDSGRTESEAPTRGRGTNSRSGE